MDQWKNVGNRIFVINDSASWWLGDWLNYGQAHYPDRYRAAIEDTSLSYQTLRNYAWVAGQFPICRRHGYLSFQHHAEVASMPEEDQEHWLRMAESSGWSRNELRRRIRDSQREPEMLPEPAVETVQRECQAGPRAIKVRVSAERKTQWEKAATDHGRDLADWIVSVLDAAVPMPSQETAQSADEPLQANSIAAVISRPHSSPRSVRLALAGT